MCNVEICVFYIGLGRNPVYNQERRGSHYISTISR